MRTSFTGLLVLLIKIGKPFIAILAKLGTVLVKLIKGVGGTKLALGAASFGAYSVLWDWRFAVTIMLCLGIHESGHVWAMRRVGMATRGFYFIPFFGGAAVPDSAFPSAYAEGYVALLGPIWGLFTAAVAYAIFLATGEPVFGVAACWMAFVNLLNLIPLYPLDGGRVLRSIMQSVHGRAGTATMLVVGTITAAYCVWQGYWLFAILGLAGIGDERTRRRAQRQASDEWADDGPIMVEAVRGLAKALGLPRDATFDRVQLAMQRFRKDPDWRADLDELRALRKKFGRAIMAFEALEKRWRKRYGYDWALHMYEVLKNTRRVVTYVPGAAQLPEDELQRLDRLVESLRAIVRRASELTSRLRDRAAALAEQRGVQSRLLCHRQRFSECDRLDPATLAAIVFFTAEPFAEEGIRDFGISYLLLEDEHFREDEQYVVDGGSDRHRTRLQRTARQNWAMATADLLIILTVNDRALGTFAEHHLHARSSEARGMSVRQLAAVLGTACLLAITLFGLMAVTGGHEAAKGAVEFFKKF
ncbi:site-2 protease family protein [Candidatus Uhrbacteria bacterium]|nr:site-2 protease family protein [Candidatus Uhrbacteria bacterium]